MYRPRPPSGPLAYNLYLKSDLVRVAKAFEVRGIPWLLIKGISLAESLYGGIAERTMVDNDIVVRRLDVVRAHEELERLGFMDREGNSLALNLSADFQHPMHFDHTTLQTGLELHWHVHAPELFRSDVDGYFERAVERTSVDLTYRTLCADDRLIQLVTHWVQHGLNKPSILCDLERAWNAQLESDAVTSQELHLAVVAYRAKRMGAFAALCLALLLLERRGRLKVPVPASLRSERAAWFARVERDTLFRVADQTIVGIEEHRLRAASWCLLQPQNVWRSVAREVWPTRARLSRIVGRQLSRREAVFEFVARQRRATRKWFGK